MKKMIKLLIVSLLMVLIPSFSHAQSIKKEDITAGSYIIGTHIYLIKKKQQIMMVH